MNKVSHTFHVRRPRLGLFKAWDWLVECFTGKPRYVVDKIEVNFLYVGDEEPEVIISGLFITETKCVARTVEPL